MSGIICILMIVSSFFGVFIPGFYELETDEWRKQAFGQDMINLILIAPFLALTSVLGYARGFYGTLLWAGTQLYILYTYLIYCFDVHFNMFFIDYCLILGLSFYALVYFFIRDFKIARQIRSIRTTTIIGIYFILTAVFFYLLWLSEIIPAIHAASTPRSVAEAGLFINPVHVLDLAFLLPGVFITGVLTLVRINVGLLMAPIFLTFFILMDLTIGSLMLIKRGDGDNSTNSLVAWLMGVLALVSFILLRYYKNALKVDQIGLENE